jgi:hypothetical protein
VLSATLDDVVLASPLAPIAPGSSRRELRVVLGKPAKAAE